jgi:predicted nucleic acid-binding Zn ribbon protein
MKGFQMIDFDIRKYHKKKRRRVAISFFIFALIVINLIMYLISKG